MWVAPSNRPEKAKPAAKGGVEKRRLTAVFFPLYFALKSLFFRLKHAEARRTAMGNVLKTNVLMLERVPSRVLYVWEVFFVRLSCCSSLLRGSDW